MLLGKSAAFAGKARQFGTRITPTTKRAGLVLATGAGLASLRASSYGRSASAAFRGGAATVALSAATVAYAEAEVDVAVAHPAFTHLRSEKVNEYGATIHLYEHAKSKAQVMSVVAPDDNKVFGITFRTPPRDSTGLPHILEHSVLCGSKKYPTKEPFVELLKGSLQTFLNAFTYPDRTCYPVASQNTEDFYNLARVYLDAVLHPRAVSDPAVLKQEGWHYEIDENGLLTYKGVVYNEMKGVYSSPDALMGRAAQQALHPDNAYSVDSGGDPLQIPQLTFDDFKAFHGEFYHPSNARVYFYGDDDPYARLVLLDEYLSEFEAQVGNTAVAKQPLTFAAPKKVVESFPASAGGPATHMTSVHWLLTAEDLCGRDELGLAVLDHLLLGTSSAALRKALTDSGLGESVLGGGLSDEMIQPTFSTGMKGVRQGDVDKVEALILETLTTLASTGFEASAVAASMNTVEFGLREFNTGSFPKGLSFMLGAMSKWIYDKDPIQALVFEEPLAQLKLAMEDAGYFQGLITRFLTSNVHRVTIEMRPDFGLEEAQQAEEKSRLAAIKAAMSEAQVAAVKSEMAALKAAQEAADTAEALATIPALRLEDLERTVKVIARSESKLEGGVVLLKRNLATASIVYADLALDLKLLDYDDVPLVPLFVRCLLETGVAGKYDATQLQREIGTKTGGVSVSLLNTLRVPADGSVADPMDLIYRLVLRGKATSDKSADLFELFGDVLTASDFGANQKRVVEMLKETKARYESAFRVAGQRFAASSLGAKMNLAGLVAEQTGGIAHYRATLEQLELAQSDWPAMASTLEKMRAQMLSKPSSVIVNLTGDEATLEAVERDALPRFEKSCVAKMVAASKTAAAAKAEQAWVVSLGEATNDGYVVPTQVNYVAKGGRFYQPGESAQGGDGVVGRFLSLDYLWSTVRVQGGAYGSSCSLNPNSGSFTFSSYRDPNLFGTLNAYDKAATFLKELEIDKAELTKAIVASIGGMDTPMTPDQKGFVSMRHYVDGTTTAQRQLWRDQVLATSPADFLRYAERLESMSLKAAVFGSAAAIDQANTKLPEGSRLSVTKLL